MMRIFKFIGIFILFVILYAQSGFAGDNKYYSEFSLKYKLNNKFDLFFTPEFRYKNNMGSIYYYHMRIGSMYHAFKNLDAALAYRYIQTKVKGQWDKNDTQYIEMILIPKIKLGKFDLSDANKFERRFIEDARDRWVYRNLITVAYPTKINKFEFTPYISNELYYDFELGKFNLNWVTLGVNKKINKYLILGVYYRDETSRIGKTSNWITNHVLGTNISVNF